MNALTLPKSFDEVTEATLLEEDWYELRLLKTSIQPNGALREYMNTNSLKAKNVEQLYEAAAEAKDYQNDNGQYAGLNWVLDLRTVSSDRMVNGRSFKVYLGIPNAGDGDRVTPMGQTVEDSKMERIKEHLEAFQSDVNGSEAKLNPGDSAMFYITRRYSDYNEREENTIDINSAPTPVD